MARVDQRLTGRWFVGPAGRIPSSFSLLTSLTTLGLGRNNLSGKDLDRLAMRPRMNRSCI
jgi:hypothetical protein